MRDYRCRHDTIGSQILLKLIHFVFSLLNTRESNFVICDSAVNIYWNRVMGILIGTREPQISLVVLDSRYGGTIART